MNLPLLTDDERHQVGLTYRKLGQQAAVELGHRLVSGEVKAARLAAWADHIQRHPQAILFCFRGGLRSRVAQAWLGERGLACPLSEGGYKALRNFLIEIYEHRAPTMNFLVVGGPTGSGKTRYLQESGKPHLDLERLAAHRGSVFGATEVPQPTQINFENALAVELLKLSQQVAGPILIENESQMIGRRAIPHALYRKMRTSPKLILDVPLAARVENVFQDYVINSKLGLLGDVTRFAEFTNAVVAISRRLGGVRTKVVLADLESCKAEFIQDKRLDSNRLWIGKLLSWYYDPVYGH